MGQRIGKNGNGAITRYVYDGEDILLEYDGTNTFVARYSHGDQVDQPLVLQKAGVGFFYYHSNHQGSITQLTDSSGTIANSYVYDSYGRRLSVTESVIQPFSYTGREYDEESGLYYYRARYLDPNTGRFLSEDSIRFRAGDQNFYRYVSNNPLNFRDPFGLQVTNPGQGAGGLPGLFNDSAEFIIDTNAQQNLFDAINEFESSLDPGETADFFVDFDPDTGEVEIVPAPTEMKSAESNNKTKKSNKGKGKKKRSGRIKGFGPPSLPSLNPPLPGLPPFSKPGCNTCPCQ